MTLKEPGESLTNKGLDHASLIEDMKLNNKLPVEERIKLAKENRRSQLQIYQDWSADPNASEGTIGGFSALRLSFPQDVYLMDAAAKGSLEDMKQLLSQGLDPNATNYEGLTALHQCCIDGSENMVKVLLEHGASVNATDKDGWTPLHAAATCGHLKIVKLLLNRGANLLAINGDGDMPFDITEDKETLTTIEKAMNDEGITPQMVEEKREELNNMIMADARTIIDEGENLDIPVNEDGATLLHVAIVNMANDVVRLLLENGASAEVEDVEGWRPVHAAAFWNNKEAIQLLVEKKNADLKALTRLGQTPYDLADDEEIKEKILNLISSHPRKYGSMEPEGAVGDSTDSNSSDNEENQNTPQTLTFVAGNATTNEINDAENETEVKSSSDEDGEKLELRNKNLEINSVAGLERVESISSRRNSVQQAKKQAPAIRTALLARQDSQEYDDSYELKLAGKMKKTPDAHASSSSTLAGPSVSATPTYTDITEDKHEEAQPSNNDDYKIKLIADLQASDRSRSSSESSPDSEKKSIDDIEPAPEAYTKQDSWNSVLSELTKKQSEQNVTVKSETDPVALAISNENSSNSDNSLKDEPIYEEYPPSIEDLRRRPSSSSEGSRYEDNNIEAGNSTTPMEGTLMKPPVAQPRTVFEDTTYIDTKQNPPKTNEQILEESGIVTMIKKPSQSINQNDQASASNNAINQNATQPPPPPYTELPIAKQRKESVTSSSSEESREYEDANIRSIDNQKQQRKINSIEPNDQETYIHRLKSNYVPLVDTSRAAERADAKRGTLLELKLKRQSSRPFSFSEQVGGSPIRSYANYSATSPKPPDSPTLIRHVFKQPEVIGDENDKKSKKSIFIQKKRCVIM